MSLVTTSNLAKMNKDKFQKKKIEPAVYPPPQVADGFKNPQLGNSFIQNQEPTIFRHPSIKNNYGHGISVNGVPLGRRDAFFKNPTLGSSFKKNHEKTIFQHPSIKNDYGFGTPVPSDKPILDFVVNGVEQHSFVKFVDQKVVSKNSLLQPQLSDQSENPDYKGPTKENLTTWNVNTPIQSISQDWKPEADFKNPSKSQKFLNNYYTQYSHDQIRDFSGDRTAGRLSEPHLYTNINFYAENKNSNDGAGNRLAFGINDYIDDLVRYSKHLLSPRGVLFMGKKFLQQSFNQRAENGIFNPIGVLLSRNNILRFKSQFEFDIKKAGNVDEGKLDEAKGGGKKALDIIKSFAGIDVDTYQDSQNAFIIDNGKSYLQSHGYGVRAELPQPLFNKLANVVGNTISNLFKKKNTATRTFQDGVETTPGQDEEITVVETTLPEYDSKDQSFVVGKQPSGEGAVPSKNTEPQVSLSTYKALSYGGIEAVRKGISGVPGKAGEDGYTAKIKASPKKSVYISYGLYENDGSDRLNKQEILEGDVGEDEIYKDVKDFIPFYINILNTDETIALRANVTDISEDITPNWEEIEYIGRPDKQYVYKNTDRKISFKVSLIPNNEEEFKIMWKKINKLTALNYPSLETISTGGQRMSAPFVKLTLGDMIKRQAGYFEQIKANPIDNTPFVLDKGMRLPMYMEVECSFVYIGSKIPQLASESTIDETNDGKLYDYDF